VTVTSASTRDKHDEPIPVDLEEFGDMVKIKCQGSGKYAGLIRLPVIRELLGDAAVQTTATLIEATPDSSGPSKAKKLTSWHSATTRIVLSGLKEDRFRVGKLLSDSHQFLQHPYVEECAELEYCNPHYLVRPGASMPKLEGAVSFASTSLNRLGSLTELNKSRVLRIFDHNGLGCQKESRFHDLISHRVKTHLKR
jgi:hypothetical protein